MRLGQFIGALAAVAVVGLLALPADAQQPQKRRVYTRQGHTVVVSRDEDGKTTTKIIVQKRSYLDPGTEPLPGERNTLDYVQNPDQHANQVLDHTIFGNDMTALPGPYDLPSSHNPWLHF